MKSKDQNYRWRREAKHLRLCMRELERAHRRGEYDVRIPTLEERRASRHLVLEHTGPVLDHCPLCPPPVDCPLCAADHSVP